MIPPPELADRHLTTATAALHEQCAALLQLPIASLTMCTGLQVLPQAVVQEEASVSEPEPEPLQEAISQPSRAGKRAARAASQALPVRPTLSSAYAAALHLALSQQAQAAAAHEVVGGSLRSARRSCWKLCGGAGTSAGAASTAVQLCSCGLWLGLHERSLIVCRKLIAGIRPDHGFDWFSGFITVWPWK